MLNGSKKPEQSGDEILYRAVERLAMIADMAVGMVQSFAKEAENKDTITPEEIAKSSELTAQRMMDIMAASQGLNTNSILSRLVVLIAAASQNKHLVGATLTVAKELRIIHLKAHYAPGKEDYYDMHLTQEVAEQLRDGLTQGLNMLPPKAGTLILPNNQIIQ